MNNATNVAIKFKNMNALGLKSEIAATTYQCYNLDTGKTDYETQSKESLVFWLRMNTVSFLAADYKYFPCAGQQYIVIDRETDFDVTGEIIEQYFPETV
jgi:hypothetical protein